MAGLIAGAASERKAVVAEPLIADIPIEAEGLAKPEKDPGRVVGVHCPEVYSNTCPDVGAVVDMVFPCIAFTVGLGNVPLKSPPAVPPAEPELLA